MNSPKKKLIEVSLPLEAINRESAREKSIRHGHPSTLHLWWARRPLATARAVLFAQLVDDPSSHPERFATVEEQDAERARLHELIEALVVWENVAPDKQGIALPSLGRTVTGRELLEMATAAIRDSNDGELPAVLDPFAGGGTIPLEAQRLGLEAHASDLNPVAVLINKALIEIPPRFAGRPPVHPDADANRLGGWPRATGLAEDVRRYGAWMRDRAAERIGHLYPEATLADGTTATVIAWIWARTVTCPNPACGIQMPLVRSWWLGKKKGKEAYVVPTVVRDESVPAGRRVEFSIGNDAAGAPTKDADGTMGGRGRGASCVACGATVGMDHIKSEGVADRMGAQLMAVVAEGKRQRVYLAPTPEHEDVAGVDAPDGVPNQELGCDPRNLWTPAYGLTEFADLFTNRQLTALTTFSDLVTEAREQVLADARAAGLPTGARLADGGTDAAAYADAIATYLGMAVSRATDLNNALVTWSNSRDQARNLFARQAIPMAWDFVEVSPFAGAAGDVSVAAVTQAEAIAGLCGVRFHGSARQADAAVRNYSRTVVSTDPPYYDNIGYSDLSDFFYVWLRRSLHPVYPELFRTMLVPKVEELVANPYRHEGKESAERYFVDGFNSVFDRVRGGYRADGNDLMTVYYAYKQQEASADGSSSTGWHTLLDGLIENRWEITATWPVRSERGGRMISVDTNALASSIVLACRPRPDDAPSTTRRAFLAALKAELPGALRAMMQGTIAPVDLAQAAIGPGISVFSRYSRVREADGSDMSVRDALLLINATLDEVLGEQESDFDPDTRFAVRWYRQYAWASENAGVADQLARSSDTSLAALERGGIFEAKGGKARLIPPADLADPPGALARAGAGAWSPATDDRVSVWEATVRLAANMDAHGADRVAELLAEVGDRVGLDAVKELGFLLFHEAEKRRDAKDALLFNALVSAWGDLTEQSRRVAATPRAEQAAFDFEDA